MIKFTFAPIKIFKDRYASSAAPTAYELPDGTKFERYAAKALSKPLSDIYKNSALQLVGYSYKQYDKNGWSFYPVQLFVNGNYEKIQWIKWRSGNKEYFVLNDVTHDKVSGEPIPADTQIDDFPVDITLCSDEEAAILKHFEHDIRTDILSMPQSELKHTKDGIPDYCSPTFYCEFSRQLSSLLTEASGCSDLAKKVEFYRAWCAVPVNYDGWTYSTLWFARLPRLPDDIDNKEIHFFYRWRSLKDKEYLSTFDEIGADNILFELCNSVPPVKLECGNIPAVVPDQKISAIF